MGIERRKRYSRGEKLSHDWVNEVEQELERLGKITGSGGITIGSSPAGIAIRGSDEESEYVALAKIDPTSGFSYPSFYDYTTQDQLTTIYPFQLYKTSFETNSWTPSLSGTATETYVYAFTLSGHYIPANTTTRVKKINGGWYTNYYLPATMHLTLSEDLEYQGSADASFRSLQYHHGAALTGTIKVWDGYLASGKKLASNTTVAVSMWGFYPTVIAANTCAVSA